VVRGQTKQKVHETPISTNKKLSVVSSQLYGKHKPREERERERKREREYDILPEQGELFAMNHSF
jgi:hypothetical protein